MTEPVGPDDELEALLEFIRDERAFDFTSYKRATLTRRIQKRMDDVGYEDFAGYQRYLADDEDEFAHLFNTILINVTDFFRDETPWSYVAAEVVPKLVAARDGHPIRVWVPGVASGQEAFTVAIVLAEAMGEESFREQVKIFATDVDEEALDVARRGIYTEKEVSNVPAPLLERYFEDLDHTYVFRSDLRRAVIFGRHDLMKDPPISRIDFLSCRNTLMYFTSDAQRKILRSFHFALVDDGFVFLGKSEALANRTTFFTPVDLKRRVFAKVVGTEERGFVAVTPTEIPGGSEGDRTLLAAALISLPGSYLLIDSEGILRFASRHARSMLNLGTKEIGKSFKDLDISYRPAELRSRIEDARSLGRAVTINDVEWVHGEVTTSYDVVVYPLVSGEGGSVGVVISFEETTQRKSLEREREESQHELETAYEELQSTVEELETTNEELQSTNEEVETTNEELQSTNEELETINEELQSTNEELEAINDELGVKSVEVNDANAFLESVLGSLSEGVIVVDRELRVIAWNRRSEELWGLRRDEVQSKYLLNLDMGFPVVQIRNEIRSIVSGDAESLEKDVQAVNRRGRNIGCHVSIGPMRPRSGEVSGAILVVREDDPGG